MCPGCFYSIMFYTPNVITIYLASKLTDQITKTLKQIRLNPFKWIIAGHNLTWIRFDVATCNPLSTLKRIAPILIFPLFQVSWDVRPQEVRQDDEDLQPRQGLQEEQQVWILLKSWPHSTSNKSHNIQAQMQRQSPVSGELLTRLSNQKSHICQNLKKNIEISFDPYPTTYRQIKKIWNLDRKKYVKFTLVSFDSFKV